MIGVPLHRLAPDGAPIEDVIDRIAGLVREHKLEPFELPDADGEVLPDGVPGGVPEIVRKLRKRGCSVAAYMQPATAQLWLTIIDGEHAYYGNVSPLVTGAG